MNAREAIKALVDGKKVRAKNDAPGMYLYLAFDGGIHICGGQLWGRLDKILDSFCSSIEWELYEEPATDEELIAEMEATAKTASYEYERLAYEHCAEMLKTRKVKP